MHQDGSTSSVSGRSFVLISTDNQDLAGKYACASSAALAAWLESQNEMLTDASVSWSRVARLAWSGRSVFLVTQSRKSSYLLALEHTVSYYSQEDGRFVQFEPPMFSFGDFLEAREL